MGNILQGQEQRQDLDRVRRNTLSDLLTRAGNRTPKKLAIKHEDRQLTYRELDDIVNQTAQAFLERGIKKGDMMTVMSKNSLDFVIVNFALARMGAIMVPINYMLSVEDIHYILNHARVKGLIASLEYAPILDQAATDMGITHRYLMGGSHHTSGKSSQSWIPLQVIQKDQSTAFVDVMIADDDVAHVLYTSGTESRPKGVMLTHKSLVSEYVSCIVDGKMAANDIVIHALPLYHSAQLHVFLGPSIYVGSSGIVLESAHPKIILETIEHEKATLLFAPPTVWIAMLRHPDFDKHDLSSLEKCYYGAAIMPKEILKELANRLPNAKFWNFYGQTEVAPLATALQPEDQLRKLGSAGIASLNVQTKLVNEQDQDVPCGEIGEIVHRSPHAMKGYLHDVKKTEEAFRHGWFHSGDLGVMDEDGYITIVDRKKDMIKTGGVNVSSREVEEIIYQLAGVSEVAVIGLRDDYWIEAVTAVIVSKKGVNLKEKVVMDYCQDHLSKFKIPKKIIFADTLPKNPSGKVLKRDLREKYQ